MFWFYILILFSHIINGLLTGFALAILRNTGPWSFSTALASSGCTKTAVLYFSVWPSYPVNKPLIQPHFYAGQAFDLITRLVEIKLTNYNNLHFISLKSNRIVKAQFIWRYVNVKGGGVQFPGEPKSGSHVTIAHQIASTFQVVHTTSLLRSDKILQICAGLF